MPQTPPPFAWTSHDRPLRLSLVVPVFNEEGAVGPFIDRVDAVFATYPEITVEFVFVNDGSTDRTLEALLERHARDARIRVVDLSRNFGKEAALTAGLAMISGDVVVPIDVDLQHPPETIPEMIALWRQGYEVVLARRTNRGDEGLAQRTTARWFYKVHNRLASPRVPQDVGDFRLMDRMVVDALARLPETRRFMKGLFAWVGFRTVTIDYVCAPRTVGQSKFNKWKLWNFAIEGITSFSTSLLRVWTYIGLIVSLLAFAYGIEIIVQTLWFGIDSPGYASLMAMILFMGGLQMLGIGIIGEYLGRTYIESKRRPVYLVRRVHTRDGSAADA